MIGHDLNSHTPLPDNTHSVQTIIRACGSSHFPALTKLALACLLTNKQYKTLQQLTSQLAQQLLELTRAQPTSAKQGVNSIKYARRRAIFYSSALPISLVINRYRRTNKLQGFFSQTQSTSPALCTDEFKHRCEQTLFLLLINKLSEFSAHSSCRNITQLELSASYLWLMNEQKVGLRQLNKVLGGYLAELTELFNSAVNPKQNTLALFALLSNYKAMLLSDSQLTAQQTELLNLIDSQLLLVQQEFNDKSQWFTKHHKQIEEALFYQDLFE